MAMRDTYSRTKRTNSLAPASRTASANGTGVDTSGYRSVMLEIDVGVGGITFDGTNKIEIKLEHSDDNAAWSGVTAAEARSAEAIGADGIVKTLNAAHATATAYKAGYFGGKRYVRGVATYSGTHGAGTVIAATVALGDPLLSPVA